MQTVVQDITVPAYICLGSNQGNSEDILRQAVESFSAHPPGLPQPAFTVGACSSLYFTEPQLYTDQPFFVNQVVRLDCSPSYSPIELLRYLQSLETALGRVRTGPRYGPRLIDLDILLFGDIQMQGEVLTIPHPRMHERAFVLVPLAEIAPELVFPDGLPIQHYIQTISYSITGNVILQNTTESSMR